MGREAAMACTEAVETVIGEHYDELVHTPSAAERKLIIVVNYASLHLYLPRCLQSRLARYILLYHS
jgi:hypothetical protein